MISEDLLQMIREGISQKHKSTSIRFMDDKRGLIASPLGQPEVRIYVWQPEDFTGETYRTRVIVPESVLPRPIPRPCGLFILNQTGTWAYALNNSEIPNPDLIDHEVSVDLRSVKYINYRNREIRLK